mgnify:CR=1 FL=1
MKKCLIFTFLIVSTLIYSQRGKTGDKTFLNRFPSEVFNEVSSASLKMINEVDCMTIHELFSKLDTSFENTMHIV